MRCEQTPARGRSSPSLLGMQPLHLNTWCPNTACHHHNTSFPAAQLLGKQPLQPPDVFLAQASQDPTKGILAQGPSLLPLDPHQVNTSLRMASSHWTQPANLWAHFLRPTQASPSRAEAQNPAASLPPGLEQNPGQNTPTKELVKGPPAHRPGQSTHPTASPKTGSRQAPRTQGVPANQQTTIDHCAHLCLQPGTSTVDHSPLSLVACHCYNNWFNPATHIRTWTAGLMTHTADPSTWSYLCRPRCLLTVGTQHHHQHLCRQARSTLLVVPRQRRHTIYTT